MEWLMISKLEGEVKGLDEEDFFFLLALRVASREKASFLLWFLVWGVLTSVREGEGLGKNSFSGTVMQSLDDLIKLDEHI